MAVTTRDRILDSARDLVLRQGFSATTVDAVLASAGSSKGAFFHHFPSKAALGRALVERYSEADARTLDEALTAVEQEEDDPGRQLIAFVRAFEEVADEVLEAPPACLFVSFIYESELGDEETAQIVAGSILHWRERLLAKLEEAAAARPGFPPVDLPSLADHVFTVMEGGFLLVRALDDPTRMRAQLAHLRHYLELLFGEPVS
ncbi:MAG TPA: TetR/AcrR family transcriptional regulator [Acidimicrobiia bacterium]|nr:TetR/AcrR family transcriptional regulator [Acidimicrobiia bacterium]